MSLQAGKYARFELERRFLVARLPEGIAEDRGRRIRDRYIKGTQLRLRRMEPLHGGETIFKLGQKHVPSPPDFSRTAVTNIYLSPDEYALLSGLEALEPGCSVRCRTTSASPAALSPASPQTRPPS